MLDDSLIWTLNNNVRRRGGADTMSGRSKQRTIMTDRVIRRSEERSESVNDRNRYEMMERLRAWRVKRLKVLQVEFAGRCNR